MISRIAVILFLTVSAAAIVSAQSQPKQLTKEEEQKKQEKPRKKIKDALGAAVSDVALLKRLENKTFFQVRADFDRAIGLADRTRQPELKLHMKLLAIQAATSE
jgi:hypothetical protein